MCMPFPAIPVGAPMHLTVLGPIRNRDLSSRIEIRAFMGFRVSLNLSISPILPEV